MRPSTYPLFASVSLGLFGACGTEPTTAPPLEEVHIVTAVVRQDGFGTGPVFLQLFDGSVTCEQGPQGALFLWTPVAGTHVASQWKLPGWTSGSFAPADISPELLVYDDTGRVLSEGVNTGLEANRPQLNVVNASRVQGSRSTIELEWAQPALGDGVRRTFRAKIDAVACETLRVPE